MSGSAARSTNERKYETSNPIVRRMIGGFFATLRELIEPLRPASTLDAGCGEGETIVRLGDLLGDRVAGVDLSAGSVAKARERLPAATISRGDVTALRFADSSFDLVLCLEVLEHVRGPERAVAELARVSARDVVVSVPYEPWFRLGSLARGKYLRTLGNHPEHVNHHGRRRLRALLEPQLEVRAVATAFPWLIASCRPR